MSDELLSYYNRELSYIRRLASQFGEAHPKIAGRLRIGPDSSDDPHVERLIEAFAYLTARIRHKLEDDLPELTESLLGVLYPHYQAPIPSMAIVQFELDPEQSQLTSGHVVPRHTEVETDAIQGEPCRFRTCYPVTLWPIELKAAELHQTPVAAPLTPHFAEAAAILRLTLRCRSKELSFSALDLRSLRFFLKGQAQHVFRLYELIFNNVMEVALAGAANDPAPVLLPKECLQAVGFERDEGMLPYSPRSFLGYRLLTEFFTFPQKFLFFDLTRLDRRALGRLGNQMEIFLYLDRAIPDLEQNVSADTFRLGCAPLVNLYTQRAEPIQVTHTDFEYRVVPDLRRPLAHEVYSVDHVTATFPNGEGQEYFPFFSVKHARQAAAAKTYWHAARRPAEGTEALGDHGTEVYLALVDLDFQPTAPANAVLDVETTCLNRDLPHRLPFGGDQPRLQLSEGGALVTRIVCLTPPTRTVRPALKRGTLWRLISHLSLNHLSLVDGEQGKPDALREILKLYDFADSGETRKMIDGIAGVASRRIVGTVRTDGPVSFCRGVEVTVQFDEERFSGSGLFLFASVLERFLALYCSVNSFSKLIATTRGRPGELRRWPPRMGEKVLA
jgi:type VI secretion system protein ImpG